MKTDKNRAMIYIPILLFSVCFPDVIDMYFIYIVEIPFELFAWHLVTKISPSCSPSSTVELKTFHIPGWINVPIFKRFHVMAVLQRHSIIRIVDIPWCVTWRGLIKFSANIVHLKEARTNSKKSRMVKVEPKCLSRNFHLDILKLIAEALGAYASKTRKVHLWPALALKVKKKGKEKTQTREGIFIISNERQVEQFSSTKVLECQNKARTYWEHTQKSQKGDSWPSKSLWALLDGVKEPSWPDSELLPLGIYPSSIKCFNSNSLCGSRLKTFSSKHAGNCTELGVPWRDESEWPAYSICEAGYGTTVSEW